MMVILFSTFSPPRRADETDQDLGLCGVFEQWISSVGEYFLADSDG